MPAINIFEGIDIDESTQRDLINYIKRKLAPQPVKIRSDFEVTCYTYEGIGPFGYY